MFQWLIKWYKNHTPFVNGLYGASAGLAISQDYLINYVPNDEFSASTKLGIQATATVVPFLFQWGFYRRFRINPYTISELGSQAESYIVDISEQAEKCKKVVSFYGAFFYSLSDNHTVIIEYDKAKSLYQDVESIIYRLNRLKIKKPIKDAGCNIFSNFFLGVIYALYTTTTFLFAFNAYDEYFLNSTINFFDNLQLYLLLAFLAIFSSLTYRKWSRFDKYSEALKFYSQHLSKIGQLQTELDSLIDKVKTFDAIIDQNFFGGLKRSELSKLFFAKNIKEKMIRDVRRKYYFCIADNEKSSLTDLLKEQTKTHFSLQRRNLSPFQYWSTDEDINFLINTDDESMGSSITATRHSCLRRLVSGMLNTTLVLFDLGFSWAFYSYGIDYTINTLGFPISGGDKGTSKAAIIIIGFFGMFLHGVKLLQFGLRTARNQTAYNNVGGSLSGLFSSITATEGRVAEVKQHVKVIKGSLFDFKQLAQDLLEDGDEIMEANKALRIDNGFRPGEGKSERSRLIINQ